MLNITRADVLHDPFPHVVKDNILPTALYEKLRSDFPSATFFDAIAERTGTQGSRVGSGFDIYRGDPEYEKLIAESEAWVQLDQYINSPKFIEKFLEVFGEDLSRLKCRVSVSPSDYESGYIEPRTVLRAEQSISDRLKSYVPKAKRFTLKKARFFTRLDIERGVGGYAKPPHCDRPNRLCSLIVYFTDADSVGLNGGELNVYAHKKSREVDEYERHPKPSDVTVVSTLRPRENLGVFFPCCNNSYHGVNAVESNFVERDFLYINVSAIDCDCW